MNKLKKLLLDIHLEAFGNNLVFRWYISSRSDLFDPIRFQFRHPAIPKMTYRINKSTQTQITG